MNQYDNDTITTLIVKHLPEFITSSNELQTKYFKPYKPIAVRFMQSQAMMGFVFLDFADRDAAETAYKQLEKINFGLYYKQVTVEYAKPDPNRQQSSQPVKLSIEQHEQAAEPISAPQGILYPPNPHLRYFYPDPTPDILSNISHAIGTVPRLYTQVLHLMNKFNMPPPFGPMDKESIPSIMKRKHDDLLASDESELEDDNDEGENAAKVQEEKVKQARLGRIAAEKQKLLTAMSGSRGASVSTPIASSTTSKITPPQQNVHKIKINIGGPATKKLKSDKQDNEEAAPDTTTQEAAVNFSTPTKEEDLTEEQKLIRDKCISMTDLLEITVFKTYAPGAPSNKLYIKNLHQQVTEQDLVDVYSKFGLNVEINLMKKGRLRGQAFITFPDEKSASLALFCTNGYPFHERPIAVAFGKK